MKINYKWKKQLLICVLIFLAALALGYLFKQGVIIVIGLVILLISAVVAEHGLRCPGCKTSLFKETMERGVKEIECPKCGEKITME